MHLYGTKVSDDTTFTLTIRGRTTGPIVWGADGTLNTARDDPIKAALDEDEMELGGAGATTVACFAGFDPTPAGNGYSTTFGRNTAYCTIVLNLMYVVGSWYQCHRVSGRVFSASSCLSCLEDTCPLPRSLLAHVLSARAWWRRT